MFTIHGSPKNNVKYSALPENHMNKHRLNLLHLSPNEKSLLNSYKEKYGRLVLVLRKKYARKRRVALVCITTKLIIKDTYSYIL